MIVLYWYQVGLNDVVLQLIVVIQTRFLVKEFFNNIRKWPKMMPAPLIYTNVLNRKDGNCVCNSLVWGCLSGSRATFAQSSSCPSSCASHQLQRERKEIKKQNQTNQNKTWAMQALRHTGWNGNFARCKVIRCPLHCVRLLHLCLLLEVYRPETATRGEEETCTRGPCCQGCRYGVIFSHRSLLSAGGQRGRGRAQPVPWCSLVLKLSWVLDCEPEQAGMEAHVVLAVQEKW